MLGATISFHVSLGWPIAAMILAWIWLPVCIGIGNLLQVETWMGVFILSVFSAIGLTAFALIYTLVTTF
jgi:hypothetical protein